MENDAAEEDEALPLEAIAVPELEQLANRVMVSPCRVADQARRAYKSSVKREELVFLTAEVRKTYEKEVEKKEERVRNYEAGKKLRNVGKAQRGSRQD